MGKCLRKLDQCTRWHRTYSRMDRRDNEGLVVEIERQRDRHDYVQSSRLTYLREQG